MHSRAEKKTGLCNNAAIVYATATTLPHRVRLADNGLGKKFLQIRKFVGRYFMAL